MKLFLLVVLAILSSPTWLTPHIPKVHATEYSAPSTYYPMDITHEVAVHPGGKELYVASIHSPLVLIVDIDSPSYPVLGGIQLPGGEVVFTPHIVFSRDGAYAYTSRRHSDEYIASWIDRSIARGYMAAKTANKESLKIHLHTFRHFFATKLYLQTRDIRYLQKKMGYRSTTSTTIYESSEPNQDVKAFTVKAVTSREEAEKLIALGYEFHYRTADVVDLFRKKVVGLD